MSPESDKTEYKRELPAADKLEREVIAFLNTDGGKIYFGIDDNGKTTGIADPDELQLKLKDRIKNNISEHALEYCSITVEELNEKHVVVLTILSGWEKPFYLNKYGMTPKGCFKRVGSSTEPISVAQIEMIFSKRVRNSLKNIPSPVGDLTFQQLKIYYQEKGKTLNDRFLDSLSLTTYDGKPNYAAYLLADENRNSIMFAKYADTTRVDLISNELMGDYCLIKSFERLMDRLTAENVTFTKITPRRRLERNLIDKVALREAVLNALIHNDYSNNAAPKIEFFSDRAEITSNGGLPYGVTEEDFFAGRSSPRNPELMRVFRDLDIVEQLGSGVPRILKAYGKDVFEITDNYIRVVLKFAKEGKNELTDDGKGSDKNTSGDQKEVTGDLKGGKKNTSDGQKEITDYLENPKDIISDRQSLILELIRENPSITRIELAEKLNINESAVQKHILMMKKMSLIERKGGKKYGQWIILADTDAKK